MQDAIVLDDARADSLPPRRAAIAVVVLALVVGLLLDVGLRGGVDNALVVLAIFVIVVMVLVAAPLETTSARALALLALAPATMLAVRTSPWLSVSNVVAALVLVGLAVCLSRSGSLLDLRPASLVLRARAAGERTVGALAPVRATLPEPGTGLARRLLRVGRAMLIAVPFLAAVVALLASADAVFAGLVVPDVDAAAWAGHVVLVVVCTLSALAVVAAARGDVDDETRAGRFGTLEIATMLLAAAAVLGLFVASQLVALTDAGDRLVASSGLTPAEYARSGFFQLCWATALIVAFLAITRALAAPHVFERSAVRVVSALVPFLATGLVIVSLRRIALYDRAFGLTMLRLSAGAAAVWMGCVLVMMAARNVGLASRRNWIFAASLATALVLVLVADIANIEGFVVNHNVTRARAGAPLDVAYLATLSDDATPAIAEAFDTTARPALRRRLRMALHCGTSKHGVARLNTSAARAAQVRRRVC